MQEVAIGDATVEFPDDMSQEDITAALDKEHTRAEQLAAFIDRPDYYVGGGSGVDIKEGALMAGTSLPFPIGDMVGLAADVEMYATDPKSHNWFNYLFTAMSILPAIPAASQLNTARKAMKAMPTAKGDTANIRTFHGGADFEKFSTDFMGKGAGAQLRGWGLYFGPEQKAKNYRKSAAVPLTSNEIFKATTSGYYPQQKSDLVDAAKSGKLTPKVSTLVSELDKADWFGNEDPLGAVRVALRSTPDGNDYISKNFPEATKAANEIGALYQVELLGKADEFMDWYEPLTKQSQHVQDSVEEALRSVTKNKDQLDFMRAKLKGLKGKEVYAEFEDLVGGPKEASEFLFNHGLKGNKLASTVPGGQDFIAFSDTIVDISKKYGIPLTITSALLAAGGEMEDETLYE